MSIVAAEFELLVIAFRDAEQSLSEYPSLEVTNERTGELLTVRSELTVENGQHYVRVSYVRCPQALQDS